LGYIRVCSFISACEM